jgi:hypothetical protein
VEGIASPESSPELSPTDFQVDLEAGRRQHRPPLPAQAQRQPKTTALRRQESMDPFLPDLDPDPEPESADLVHGRGDVRDYELGYDVNDLNPTLGGQHSDDGEDEEGMTGSVLLPGSDIF